LVGWTRIVASRRWQPGVRGEGARGLYSSLLLLLKPDPSPFPSSFATTKPSPHSGNATMARPVHPETLFHLEPVDAATEAVLQHQDNAPFVSTSSTGDPALEIGYHVSSRPRGGRVIARLGREADLVLPAKSISHVHVAFEVHPISHAILLYVRAEKTRSVRVEPGGLRQDGNFRQLVLVPGVGYRIAIGESPRLFQFWVKWRLVDMAMTCAVEAGFQAAQARAINPRWVKTEDDDESNIRSWYNTRLQSGAVSVVRDAQLREKIGDGTFGSVYRAVDLDSGHFIAVKVVGLKDDKGRAYLHREIKTMQTLNHPHIIEFFGYKSYVADEVDTQGVQIFMPLRTGSVCDLAPLPKEIGQSIIFQLSYQMLSALDYLSERSLCHRDVKPANILYEVNNGNYTFQLADFGLVNYEQLAETVCGTRVFSAPELHPDYGLGKYRQTPKMDVWSLFVTVASLSAGAGFQEQKLATGSYSEILTFVRAAAAVRLPGLEAMARENPELRASAAQMLVMHFDGKGLTTRRSDVGPIPEVLASAATETRPGVPAPRPERQNAPQGVTSEPKRISPPETTPPPPPTAGPSTRKEDVQSTQLPRRWDATKRVTKVKSPAVPERLDPQEMDIDVRDGY
ncbi:NUAK family SNF1-like kinase 1, partial [Tolypocladium ophioglossoides CBS 100239]